MTNLQLKSKSDMEMEINRVLIHFEKEFMGRGPVETRSYIMDDFIVVRLKGVLTATELKLAHPDDERSTYLLKQVRQQLLERGRPLLETQIQDIVGVGVQSVHTDISTRTGERFIIFTLQARPDIVKNGAERTTLEPRRHENGYTHDKGAK